MPEDDWSFKRAVNAANYYESLKEMDEWLRGQIKYQDREELQDIRDKLTEVCHEHDVDLWE